MPREVEPTLNERAFVLDALLEKTRMDGRGFDEFRKLQLKLGDDYGVADVTLGKTRVLARVTAEITKPFPDRQFDGIFTIITELSPMASPAFEVGRQTDQEVILSRMLEKAIRRSNALDTESLCIIAGEKCWSIRADVSVLDYDGGLADASCIAVVAALQHFRRPEISIQGEHVTVYSVTERVPVPLSMMHQPICITFSFFHDGDVVLLDATLQEEHLRQAELIITINRHGELCQMAKLGGLPVDALILLNCTNVALVKVQDITRYIAKELEDDEKARSRTGLFSELTAENERYDR